MGRSVLSSNDNFLLFGANCTENTIPVQRFIRLLVAEISDIEKSSHTVYVNKSPVTVNFHFAELPNAFFWLGSFQILQSIFPPLQMLIMTVLKLLLVVFFRYWHNLESMELSIQT